MESATARAHPPELYIDRMATPIDDLTIVTDATHLRAIAFAGKEAQLDDWLRRRFGAAALRERRDPIGVRDRLERYFAGEIEAIDEIPVVFEGSEFERSVWNALRKIPAGHTTTYGTLAVDLGFGLPSSRAVGLANGANPIPVVVPCHRVIGANGNLTGFGGGMHRKRWLLQHEGVLLIA